VTIKIVFLDCDGTLTKVKSSWEYLHRRLGIWNNNADMYQELFRRGEIDYHEFCRRDALHWKGLSVSRIEEMVNEIPYYEGSAATIKALKASGIFTVIVSTGLSFLVDKVRGELGIDRAFSNHLLSEEGRLTGDIKINVEYEKKGGVVKDILREMGYRRDEACAVGDGEGDRGMFEAVALPIGFDPHDNILPFVKYALNDDSLFDVVKIISQYRSIR
jgi:phosphoserine phosphatase